MCKQCDRLVPKCVVCGVRLGSKRYYPKVCTLHEPYNPRPFYGFGALFYEEKLYNAIVEKAETL